MRPAEFVGYFLLFFLSCLKSFSRHWPPAKTEDHCCLRLPCTEMRGEQQSAAFYVPGPVSSSVSQTRYDSDNHVCHRWATATSTVTSRAHTGGRRESPRFPTMVQPKIHDSSVSTNLGARRTVSVCLSVAMPASQLHILCVHHVFTLSGDTRIAAADDCSS